MNAWRSWLLLFGVIFGLLGQEAVFARAIPDAMANQSQTSASQTARHVDCVEMRGLAKRQSQSSEKPCEGKNLDCMAKMGCAAPVALLPPLPFDTSSQFRTTVPRLMPVAVMIGRDIAPEPEPPAHLG